MRIDKEDIKLLKGFYYLKKEGVLWELTLKLYPECKNDYERNKKYIFLKRRAKRMGKEIFLIEKSNGSSIYTLTANVKFCRRKFPDGTKDCVMIKSEGRWTIIAL